MSSSASGHQRPSGFSLLEVVISLAIFTTGLGGFSLLLLMSIQETASSGMQTLVVGKAQSLAAELLLVPGMAHWTITPVDAPACLAGGDCVPEQMAGAALHRWQQLIEQQVPGGTGVICRDSTPDDGDRDDAACDGAGGPVVKVFWSEPGSNRRAPVRERRVVTRLPLP